MAGMVPDSCPSRATVGEKRLYGLLRDALPDHFTAWYEPEVAGRHPDFTLLADDFGLLVLEVKGWYAGQIARANDDEVELHRTEGGTTKVEVHANPNRQAREYVLALMDRLRGPSSPSCTTPTAASAAPASPTAAASSSRTSPATSSTPPAWHRCSRPSGRSAATSSRRSRGPATARSSPG